MCAVTDDGLGRSVKWLMKKKFREHFQQHSSAWSGGKVTSADRRKLIVQKFDEAITEFHRTGKEQIMRAHQRCGSGLLIDGSENAKIKISGYEGDIVL